MSSSPIPHSNLFAIPLAILLNDPKSFLLVVRMTHFSGPNPAFLASATSLIICGVAASASKVKAYFFLKFNAGQIADAINAPPKMYKS